MTTSGVRAGHAIGLALAAVANLVSPQRIIVFGEGLAAYDLFSGQVRRAFNEQAFGAAGRCPPVIRPLPFEEWARGAAAVSIQALLAGAPLAATVGGTSSRVRHRFSTTSPA